MKIIDKQMWCVRIDDSYVIASDGSVEVWTVRARAADCASRFSGGKAVKVRVVIETIEPKLKKGAT